MKFPRLLAKIGLCYAKDCDARVAAVEKKREAESLWLRRVIEEKTRECAELRSKVQVRDKSGHYAHKNGNGTANGVYLAVENTSQKMLEYFERDLKPKLKP